MDLYAELILDHSKAPHGAGLREPFEAEVHHVNPTCGDEVRLRVHLEGETVADISHDSIGCSISIAATSMMMQDAIGEPLPQVLARADAVRAMLTSRGKDPGDAEQIGDAVALAGVSRYPARVKCALLGWSAFTAAVAQVAPDRIGPR